MFQLIKAGDVHAGATVKVNDWPLHVNVVVPPEPPGQLTSWAVAEFDFLLHFTVAELVLAEQP